MECPFCNEEVDALQPEPAAHLLVTLTGTLKEQNVHVHGTLDDGEFMLVKMVDAIIRECKLEKHYINKGA